MTVRIHVHINVEHVPSRESTVLYDAQQKLAKCYNRRDIGCGIAMWFRFAIIARLWTISLPMMRVTLLLQEHKRTTFLRSRYRLGFKIELWTTTVVTIEAPPY